MNKRFSFTLIVLVLVVVSALMVACGSSNSIVGTWEGDLDTIKFNSDGTMTTSVLGVGVDGTYKFVDSDTITLTNLGVGIDYDFEISGSKLYLKNSGFTLTYTKAR